MRVRGIAFAVALVVLLFLGLGLGGHASAADPLAGWHPVELEWQKRFQGAGSWGWIMRAISALGPGSVLAAMVAALFYGYDARLATRLALLMFVSLWFRELLALGLESPRPFWLEPRLRTFGDSAVKISRFGLPSGHALVASAFWFRVALALAVALPRARAMALTAAGVLVAAIAVSRVYLGVHFISDVVAGIAVGVPLGLLSRRWEDRVEGWYGAMDRAARMRWSFVVGLAMGMLGAAVRWTCSSAVLPTAWGTYGAQAQTLRVFFELGGTVSGVGLGLAMLGEWPGAGGPWWRRGLRILVAGALVKWGLRDPLAAAITRGLAEQPELLRCAATFASGVLQGWVIWGGLPWLYLRTGWTSSDGRIGTELSGS